MTSDRAARLKRLEPLIDAYVARHRLKRQLEDARRARRELDGIIARLACEQTCGETP